MIGKLNDRRAIELIKQAQSEGQTTRGGICRWMRNKGQGISEKRCADLLKQIITEASRDRVGAALNTASRKLAARKPDTLYEFNKPNLTELRVEIDNALQDVARRRGITFRLGNARFLSETCTFQLEAAVIKNGKAQTRERSDWTKHAASYGLPVGALDAEFEFSGARYKIIGLNTKAPKYAVLAKMLGTDRVTRFQPKSVIPRIGMQAMVQAARENANFTS